MVFFKKMRQCRHLLLLDLLIAHVDAFNVAQFSARSIISSKKATSCTTTSSNSALSSDYLENDLVAVVVADENLSNPPRLCVVRPDNTVFPLCQHEDDVETDLFLDAREFPKQQLWQSISDEQIAGSYGEGWYGQRPVPSLGGGPGYGAEADEIWSVDEELIEKLQSDGVDLPVLDVGPAHGEQARGGSF